MSAAEATLEEQEQPDEQKVQLQPLTQAPQENSQPVTVEGHLPESIPYQDHPEVAEQGHVAEAPPAQAHFGHHQQLLYAHAEPNSHHLAHLQQQEPHQPTTDSPHEEHETHADGRDIEHAHPQVPHAAHELALPHSGSMVMPHPASFAQQLMDPNISQQQIAQYHQQIAQFQPQAYHQQYHHGHLQEVPPLYFAQGIPPAQLQAYQDAAGSFQDPSKLQDMSIDEAAAAHLTALRNTGRADGQIAEGHPPQVALGQPPLHLAVHAGIPEGTHPNAAREAYLQANPQALLAASGRAPSKRKAWRASHEGQAAESGEQPADGGRARRKQTRRPDRLCHQEGCFVTPTYNYPNEKKRIFCVSHKLEGMVNVVAKRCAHPDCTVNPRFNYEGNTRGMYCSEHKLEGMVNVIDRRCQEPECKKFPSHNYPGSHKKLYCATHKKEGMVDMSHGSN